MSDSARKGKEFIEEKSISKQKTHALEQEESRHRRVKGVFLELEEHYRFLSENIASGFAYCKILFDQERPQDFIYLDVNSAFESLTGLTNVIGKKVSEVIPGIRESDWELFEIYGRVALTGKPERFEKYVEALKNWFAVSVSSPKKEYIVAIFDVITERKQAEEVLKESESKFRTLAEQSLIGVSIKQDGVLKYVNAKYADMHGYAVAELLNDFPTLNLVPLDYRQMAYERNKKRAAGEMVESPHVMKRLKKNGEIIDVEAYGTVASFQGRPARFGFILDITKRKRAEEALKASLREKEILLREVHHRVKNNMQVISSLFDLQASSSGNPEFTEMCRESQRRIRSMALIHEQLYYSKDFAKVDLAGYVRSLSQELFQSCTINPGKIDMIIQADGDIYVDINKAIPCGLILNELISNALKHAFTGDGPGELRIVMAEKKDTEIDIRVRDNGSGLPDVVDIHAPRSVGLYLVKGLVKNQLRGQIEIRRDNGTEFRIKFPL